MKSVDVGNSEGLGAGGLKVGEVRSGSRGSRLPTYAVGKWSCAGIGREEVLLSKGKYDQR